MKTAVIKLYEGMFLVDSAQVSDWDAVARAIKKLLGRSDAEIVSLRNWGERKLAYEINHKSRGTYALCYFKADAEKIKNIEKDVNLSEQIMRVLILGTESRDKEDIAKDMYGLKEENKPPKTDESRAEQASPKREIEEADEPEQSDEPVMADAIDPEQSVEPAIAHVSEPEEPAEPVSEDMTEAEKPAETASEDVIEAEKPAEPASEDVIEPEKPAETASEDVIEPEQPATTKASDTTEPQQPQTEHEPKKQDKKKFFNW